jgi:hypothetical protein
VARDKNEIISQGGLADTDLDRISTTKSPQELPITVKRRPFLSIEGKMERIYMVFYFLILIYSRKILAVFGLLCRTVILHFFIPFLFFVPLIPFSFS